MFQIHNRRYTGSKYKLINWMRPLILEKCSGEVFFDVFSGTGVVTSSFLGDYKKFVINDFLYSNEVIFRAFFSQSDFNLSKLINYAEYFNTKIEICENYFSINFGDKFFKHSDAMKIGSIREFLDFLKQKNDINQKEFDILLASLLYSSDRIANTVGHYDAYIKKPIVGKGFVFELIEPIQSEKEFEVYREDSNKLVRYIKADVAFIDPPYNSRQYSRFYHVLENLTKWEKPDLYGVALKPSPENMSSYCTNSAAKEFEDLINNLNSKFIVVTYNNTYNSKSSSSRNKISREQIESILTKKGRTEVFSTKHKFFDAGKTNFDNHLEFLFITKVGI